MCYQMLEHSTYIPLAQKVGIVVNTIHINLKFNNCMQLFKSV